MGRSPEQRASGEWIPPHRPQRGCRSAPLRRARLGGERPRRMGRWQSVAVLRVPLLVSSMTARSCPLNGRAERVCRLLADRLDIASELHTVGPASRRWRGLAVGETRAVKVACSAAECCRPRRPALVLLRDDGAEPPVQPKQRGIDAQNRSFHRAGEFDGSGAEGLLK
jgi:hypothetical protein